MAVDPLKVQNKSWPWHHYFCSFLLILSKVMLPGPAFWTFGGSIAIKWLSYIPSLRFGGGRVELFWFRPVILKIMRIYVIFIWFRPNYHPPLPPAKGFIWEWETWFLCWRGRWTSGRWVVRLSPTLRTLDAPFTTAFEWSRVIKLVHFLMTMESYIE